MRSSKQLRFLFIQQQKKKMHIGDPTEICCSIVIDRGCEPKADLRVPFLILLKKLNFRPFSLTVVFRLFDRKWSDRAGIAGSTESPTFTNSSLHKHSSHPLCTLSRFAGQCALPLGRVSSFSLRLVCRLQSLHSSTLPLHLCLSFISRAGLTAMHTLKVSWVGQTFALAKRNESDSGGKKSRVRRSKEERKAMVESFIKKYQKKNNGNFPSLNLTHKEVGGSFYTVREIVRDIIQENRVLGPAKLTPQENKSNGQFSQEYFLGSIAIEPQIALSVQGNETQHDSFNDGDSDERVESSKEKHNADKGLQIINRSQVDLKTDLSVLRAEAEVVMAESVTRTSKVIDLTNVKVETFPLKSITEGADCVHETISGSTASSETLDEKQNAGVNLGSTTDNCLLNGFSFQEMSAPEDDKVKEDHARSVIAAAESTKKELSYDASSSVGPKDIREDAPEQAINIPNGVPSNSLNGTFQKTDAEKSFQETEIKPKPEGPASRSSPKKSNPTLDRMNLETWEVSSRSSSSKQTNPFLAIFKAFISSFVKFWSE